MKSFVRENDDIIETMKTHLIGDFDKFGITEDDYMKFFNQRAKIVSRELSKRMIEQQTGMEEQIEEQIEELEPVVEDVIEEDSGQE
jgi:hypothetical protein